MVEPSLANDSTSWAPAYPALMRRVAEASVALSASLTVRPGSSASAAAFSVYDAVPLDSVSAGGISLSTVMATAPLVCIAPSAPELPRSSTAISICAAPGPVAVNSNVASTVFRLAALACSTSVVSPFQLPLSTTAPGSLLNDSIPLRKPLAVDKVMRSGAAPASMSATVMALPVPEENDRLASWGVTCGPGTPNTGASLTAATVMAMLVLALLAPPLPLLPRSSTARSSCAAPA